MLVPLSQSALTDAVSVATTASAGSSTESRAVGDNVRVHRISSSGIMHAVLWSVGNREGRYQCLHKRTRT